MFRPRAATYAGIGRCGLMVGRGRSPLAPTAATATVLPTLCSIWNLCVADVFLLTMERMDRPQYGKQPSSTAAYEAGLRAAFVVCHEPLPRSMEEVLERLQRLEGNEVEHRTS